MTFHKVTGDHINMVLLVVYGDRKVVTHLLGELRIQGQHVFV